MGNAGIRSRRMFLKSSAASLAVLSLPDLWQSRAVAADAELLQRAADVPDSHPLAPAIKLAAESLTSLEPVKDYRCVFIRKERIGSKLLDSQLELKIREEPFSVYLRFQQPSAGREALFVSGKHENKMLAHDVGLAGLAGTLELDPTGSFAMGENHYPITMIGMRNMTRELIAQWLTEVKISQPVVKSLASTRLGRISARGFEVSHAQPRSGVKFQTARFYSDESTGYPVRLQAFNFPGRREREPQLAEDYLYSDVVVNVGLTDHDFSTRNPKYKF